MAFFEKMLRFGEPRVCFVDFVPITIGQKLMRRTFPPFSLAIIFEHNLLHEWFPALDFHETNLYRRIKIRGYRFASRKSVGGVAFRREDASFGQLLAQLKG